METSRHEIESIENENWRLAKGINQSRKETNSALAPRDYSVSCKLSKICVIKGYHIWWCSTHHQPNHNCDTDERDKNILKLEDKIDRMKKVLGL